MGVDIRVMRNVFLRGEFEYVHFFPMNGITVNFVTAYDTLTVTQTVSGVTTTINFTRK